MGKRATTIPAGLNPHDVALTPSRLPRGVQWVLIVLFLLGVVGSVFFLLTQHWRRGAVMLGVSMMWLAVVRRCVDSPRLGVLSVRSRRFDVAFTFLSGFALTYLAYSVDSLGS